MPPPSLDYRFKGTSHASAPGLCAAQSPSSCFYFVAQLRLASKQWPARRREPRHVAHAEITTKKDRAKARTGAAIVTKRTKKAAGSKKEKARTKSDAAAKQADGTPPLEWRDATLQLRPYQKQAVAAVLAAHEAGRGQVLVSMATGTGKTVIFASLARHYAEQQSGAAVVVLIHRSELVEQTLAQFARIWPGVEVGVVKAKRKEYGQQVTVASVQTASRGAVLSELAAREPALLVVDEAHHASARTWRETIRGMGFGRGGSSGKLAVAVTATPWRFKAVESADFVKEWGSPVFQYDTGTAIEEGHLSPVVAYRALTATCLEGIKSTRSGGELDFSAKQLSAVVNSPGRNALVVNAYRKYADGRKAVAFCVDVDHARALRDAFNDEGIPTAVVHGAMRPAERAQALDDLRSGRVSMVTNCELLTEGFDEPSIDCVLMARPTRSKGLYTQCVGRGLRQCAGKEDCLVIDFTDRHHTLRTCGVQDAVPSATYENLPPPPPPGRGVSKVDDSALESGRFELLRRLAWADARLPLPAAWQDARADGGVQWVACQALSSSMYGDWTLYVFETPCGGAAAVEVRCAERYGRKAAPECSWVEAGEGLPALRAAAERRAASQLQEWQLKQLLEGAVWRGSPASTKQVQYLNKLGGGAELGGAPLTKAEASLRIDQCKLQRNAAMVAAALLRRCSTAPFGQHSTQTV